MARAIRPPFVLLLGGTSLTAGRFCTPPYGWPWRLQADMEVSPECKGEIIIINTAQGSQTSNFGAAQAALMAPLRPSHVLMEDFAINDCAIGPVSIPQATANFNSMVASYRAANPDVVIVHQTMSPASAGDANRVNLPTYYDNGLANAVLNDVLSIDNYYGSALVPGGWVKPLPPELTVGTPTTSQPSGFFLIGSTETWNPADKSATITLSGDLLTATRASAGGSFTNVRGTVSKNAGKWYFEVHIDALAAANDPLVGIAKSTASLTNYLGSDADAYGYYVDGTWKNSGTSISTGGSHYGVGDTVGIAFDLTNNKVWARVSGGPWNGSPTANPTTNVGGVSIGAGTYFPAVGTYEIGDVLTGLFTVDGDALHPIWTNAFQIYSYPNILAWARQAMADYWPD